MLKNPEYMRNYMLKRYHRRRALAIAQLGGKCVICGSENNLQFDHKDPKTKTINIAKKLSSLAKVKWEEEVKKCQLLCRNCHNDKTIKDRGLKKAKGNHGTVSTYKYCGPPKCELCKAAKREIMRRWRAKRKLNKTSR